MPLPHDLLEQAQFLAGRETHRPRQASLRRAVSSAYYAAFHLLVEAASSQASPAVPSGLTLLIHRALEHGEMKQAAKSFASNQLARHVQSLLPGPLSAELVIVARNFSQLQEHRHEADYDLTVKFGRARVRDVIVLAEELFQNWNRIRGTEEAKVFLAALMFHKRWNK